jgi:hypothetical protein
VSRALINVLWIVNILILIFWTVPQFKRIYSERHCTDNSCPYVAPGK